MDSYKLPVAGEVFEHELEIKRSRFIIFLSRVSDSQQAREFIDLVKAEYPDARHHCSAFIHHVENAQPVERFSDDGEPSGTAGKPMMEQLKGSGLLDIAAVVVRYFGGIKLGAGGLVHAYSNAVGETLPLVRTATRARKELYQVSLAHTEAGRVESEIRARNIVITDVHYGSEVNFTLATNPGTKENLADTLAALTAGRAKLHSAGEQWVEWDN
ncbi:YigZ family protein [Corynebacterium caspium]|uniref:YigZ family protein n=1 Tax=Corynebacterium caspium TaxID=234828 RepID=UPI00036820A8|nr:YigZ family protein [Corynebacterium caspium]WKD59020.1 IMPACT family member YigZ [Corynebacterium caspium DSM 44850]